MENPRIIVDIDGDEQEIELLLLSSTRRLSDERFIQDFMGYERYRDWARGNEGWSAPDAQEALIHASIQRAGISFTSVDVDAEVIVDAITDALEGLGDGEDPTNGE